LPTYKSGPGDALTPRGLATTFEEGVTMPRYNAPAQSMPPAQVDVTWQAAIRGVWRALAVLARAFAGNVRARTKALVDKHIEQPNTPESTIVDQVRCRRLVIVDAHGVERIVAFVDGDIAQLSVRTEAEADGSHTGIDLVADGEADEQRAGMHLIGSGNSLGGAIAVVSEDDTWMQPLLMD